MESPQIAVDRLISWAKAHNPRNLDVLIPISGGSDSAFTFWIYNQAFPGKVTGLFFGEILRARPWFESIGRVQIEKHKDTFPDRELYRYARALEIKLQKQMILIGTRNRTEFELGAFSLASRVTEYLPLNGMWKSDILTLCEHVGVPEEIRESSKRADPVCGRPEELAVIPFAAVDLFLSMKVGETVSATIPELSAGQVKYLEGLIEKSKFKQSLPETGPFQ